MQNDTVDDKSPEIARASRSFFAVPIRFLFGYDIFLSYARKDAAEYAEFLEQWLEAAGYATFRDDHEIAPGDPLNSVIRRAVRRSRLFILVDTPTARKSGWVVNEVKVRLQFRKKSITRIRFRGLEGLSWVGDSDSTFSQRLEGFVWLEEPADALASGKPSRRVLEAIPTVHRSLRLRTLMRIVLSIVIFCLLSLLAVSVAETFQAKRDAKVALSRQLASQAVSGLWQNPRESAKTALRAWDTYQTAEAKDALDQSFSQSNVEEVLVDPDQAPLSSAVFSHDGKYVVTSTFWDKIWLWDIAKSTTVRSFKSDGLFRPSADSMSPDGKYILAGLEDDGHFSLVVYEVATGVEIGRFVVSPVGPITSAVFSSTGKYIATTGEDYAAAVWDANQILHSLLSSAHGGTINVSPLKSQKLHTDVINSVRFSRDELYLLTASQDGRAEIWEWGSGRKMQLRRYSTALFSAEFDPVDQNVVLTGGQDGHATIWKDARSASPNRNEVYAHELGVTQASFDATQTRFLTTSYDGTAAVWSYPNSQASYSLEGHRGALTGGAFSPDGKSIVTSSVDSTARIWHAAAVPNIQDSNKKREYLRELLSAN